MPRTESRQKPRILAPAGDRQSFLAAVAAGADAVYCGLKRFSARMEADNFSMDELSRLNALARQHHVQVHVAFNTLIKPHETDRAYRQLYKLTRYVNPHAIIVQDPGIISLARQAGYTGGIHLSTLANCTFSEGLYAAADLGIRQVVLPRELNVDEIRRLSDGRPDGLDLEVFIHGALCYGISGRCYWSSWLGGRSSLRGRCVQPCRRIYRQDHTQPRRFFSCRDLSADVLVKVLKTIPGVTTWKIEGRKKSPHYVFYLVTGYRMLRDQGHDPGARKTALSFIEYAMGRPSSHYNLLPQRPQNPLEAGTETGSGLFIGRVKPADHPCVVPREPLLKDDLLRIGYEEDPGHFTQRVTRPVPRNGRLVLTPRHGRRPPRKTPVFIVDRREPEITTLISDLEQELERYRSPGIAPAPARPGPEKCHGNPPQGRVHLPGEHHLFRSRPRGRIQGTVGRWLTPDIFAEMGRNRVKRTWWWLPPVIWPDQAEKLQAAVDQALTGGARFFMLNMTWQIRLFKQPETLNLWAGPFCNVANTPHLDLLAAWGFSGCVVSPELNREDFLALPASSPLPLAVVVSGLWPLAVSRTVADDLKINHPFYSPRREPAWATTIGENTWVFPGWPMDITTHQDLLASAGYTGFIHIHEPVPQQVTLKQRPGNWNWHLSLL